MPNNLEVYVDPEDDQYYIMHDPPIGPYDTKRDALEGLAGVTRFYKHEYQPDATDLALEEIL